MKPVTTFLSFLIGAMVACSPPKAATADLYQSSTFTADNSFTTGAEGPAVDKDGNVYAVNFQKESTICKLDKQGKGGIFIELADSSDGNGLRFNSKGDLLVADYTRHNILKVDMATKQVSVYAHNATMNQPNDIAIDSKDRLYASDPNWKAGTGRIWRIDNDGKATILEDNMGTTNGIEVSPDEKHLYVNESVQRKVWVYDLSSDGNIGNKRLLIEFPDFGFDGMRCDVKGNLYMTRYGKGTVVKVSPEGKILREINLTGKNCSNICFGGKDGRTAYVTLQDTKNMETFRVEDAGREWKMMQ